MGRDVSNQPPSISVVLAPVDEATVLSSAGCAAVDAVLDDNEKAQLGRMRASGRRAQFILSRMMLRRALSRRADISPDDWRFIVRLNLLSLVCISASVTRKRLSASLCRPQAWSA